MRARLVGPMLLLCACRDEKAKDAVRARSDTPAPAPTATFAPTDAEIAQAVAESQDFATHKRAFLTASRTLIRDGTCTVQQLRDYGGWVKSTTTFKAQPIYFTYCGPADVDSRFYLNVRSGRVFQVK